MARIEVSFVGGPTVRVDVLIKHPRLGVHRSLGAAKGYVLTDLWSMRCLTLVQKEQEAKRIRRELIGMPEELWETHVRGLNSGVKALSSSEETAGKGGSK